MRLLVNVTEIGKVTFIKSSIHNTAALSSQAELLDDGRLELENDRRYDGNQQDVLSGRLPCLISEISNELILHNSPFKVPSFIVQLDSKL